MASQRLTGRTEEEGVNTGRFHSSPSPEQTEHRKREERNEDGAPAHPVSRMQGPFEESIMESDQPIQPLTAVPDRKTRHKKIVEEEEYNSSYTFKWRHNPNSKYHPLWKLMAQIAFGIHLLHQQLAKSDEEVVRILHTHVDEMDRWVEITTEDLDQAFSDISERINHLKLPLEHVSLFDTMLEDHAFRNSILDGNEKIELVVDRTTLALNDITVDVRKGMEATTELAQYLDGVAKSWNLNEDELRAILGAMRGNAEAWLKCYRKLHLRGHSLGVALHQLRGILTEMAKRVGLASRRSVMGRHASASNSANSTPPRVLSPPPISRYARSGNSTGATTPKSHRSAIPNKPLPEIPIANRAAGQAKAIPQRNRIHSENSFEHPRKDPTPPTHRRTKSMEETEKSIKVQPNYDDNPEGAKRTGRKLQRKRSEDQASVGRKSGEERRSRSRSKRRGRETDREGRDTSRSRSKSKADSVRSKLSDKLRSKSNPDLKAAMPSTSVSDALTNALTRTWSIRKQELVETSHKRHSSKTGVTRIDSAINRSNSNNAGRANGKTLSRSSSLKKSLSLVGLGSPGPADSAYESGRSIDMVSPTIADKSLRTQSPLPIAEVTEEASADEIPSSPILGKSSVEEPRSPDPPATNSPKSPSMPWAQSPSQARADSPAFSYAGSPRMSRRPSQLSIFPPVSHSPFNAGTRSPTPTHVRPSVTRDNSDLNEAIKAISEEKPQVPEERRDTPSPGTRHQRRETATTALPQMQFNRSPPTKKKRGLKLNFKWKFSKNKNRSRPGSAMSLGRT